MLSMTVSLAKPDRLEDSGSGLGKRPRERVVDAGDHDLQG